MHDFLNGLLWQAPQLSTLPYVLYFLQVATHSSLSAVLLAQVASMLGLVAKIVMTKMLACGLPTCTFLRWVCGDMRSNYATTECCCWDVAKFGTAQARVVLLHLLDASGALTEQLISLQLEKAMNESLKPKQDRQAI